MANELDGILRAGDVVELVHEHDCIVPAGQHIISHVNEDGTFKVGGNTVVFARRVLTAYRDGSVIFDKANRSTEWSVNV